MVNAPKSPQSKLFSLAPCLWFLAILLVLPGTSQMLDPATLGKIDDFVADVMKCRNVPALSLTAVTGPLPGDVLTRGYGMADIDHQIPATKDTRFAVGSVTKAFTITLLANLLSEFPGIYSWDTPVKDIMGDDFQFSDEYRTKFATLKDLAAHKMVLSNYVLPIIAGIDLSHSPMEYCRRMKYLKPIKIGGQTAQMRVLFVYSNYMYMLLGCVAEKLGNDTYANLLHKRILEPLNMTSTILAPNVTNWTATEYALPYVISEGNLTQINTDVISGLSPADSAGSLLSTSEDMGKWMRFHLGLSGVHLADPNILLQTYLPQFSTPLAPGFVAPPVFPFSDESFSYAMAWHSGSYREFRTTEHDGLVSGYGAKLRLFRDVKRGVYVDTSGPMFYEAYAARLTIAWYVGDILLGLTPVINTTTACSFPEPWRPAANNNNLANAVVPQPVSEKFAKRCLGMFGHPLFGNVTVSVNDSLVFPGFMELSFGRLARISLGFTHNDPRHPDLVGGPFHGPLWYVLGAGPFKDAGILVYAVFSGAKDTEGEFANVTMRMPTSVVEGPLTFTRGLTWDDGDTVPMTPATVAPFTLPCSDLSAAPSIHSIWMFSLIVSLFSCLIFLRKL